LVMISNYHDFFEEKVKKIKSNSKLAPKNLNVFPWVYLLV